MDAYGEYDDESTPPVREAECVDVVTGAWDAIPPILTARWGGTAAGVGGKLLICGGTECPDLTSPVDAFTFWTKSRHSIWHQGRGANFLRF